jgi:ketosteroid isomerase-like protein
MQFKKTWFVAVLAILSLCSLLESQQTGSSSSTSSRAADEAMLRRLNEQLLSAHDKADVVTLERIEADEFTLSGDFGTVNKQAHLDRVRKRGSQPEPVNRQITAQQVRLYGDFALITETDHASGSAGASEYETTSVWVRSADRWRVVHLHFSELASDAKK